MKFFFFLGGGGIRIAFHHCYFLIWDKFQKVSDQSLVSSYYFPSGPCVSMVWEGEVSDIIPSNLLLKPNACSFMAIWDRESIEKPRCFICSLFMCKSKILVSSYGRSVWHNLWAKNIHFLQCWSDQQLGIGPKLCSKQAYLMN